MALRMIIEEGFCNGRLSFFIYTLFDEVPCFTAITRPDINE